ncbi:MAG: ABC transporter permease subunit [Spirochaetaceae bacterium]|nr:ABC transporter permease subunit [Spirochaetaceae bacterium]
MARRKDSPGKKTPLVLTVKKELQKNWTLYLIVTLPLAYLILFKYIPMYGVQIAFRDYNPTRTFFGSPWVGLKHFRRFMAQPQFFNIIRNTVSISFYWLATFPLPIVLALLLNYIPSRRFKKTVQMASYAPYFISTVVMAGIILRFLDDRSGIINLIRQAFGLDAVLFMAKPELFYHIYIWSGVWQSIGFSSVIYIASLAGVPPELHEAAIVDGAVIFQRILHIDLPSLAPTISILLILACGGILSVGYEKIFLLQNALNATKSEVISTYVYKVGLQSVVPQFSFAAAIDLFVSAINVIILIIVNRAADRLSGSSLF